MLNRDDDEMFRVALRYEPLGASDALDSMTTIGELQARFPLFHGTHIVPFPRYCMEEIEGTVLAGRSFDPVYGRVVIEDGYITAVEETPEREGESDHIILPAFVNAHTHVGDSVAKEAAVGLGLQEAVVPPDSLKHRHLKTADEETLISSMHRTLRFMQRTGTAAFLDFREFGVSGARALREAAAELDIEAFIFGSDDPAVLDVADGFGASGANDDDFTARRAAAMERDVPFAIHAGEPDATDIHPALDLEPDLLVHMVHAEAEHLKRVADQEVPIAVCPRANQVLGVGRPPLETLLEHTTVALGSDNVMLNAPSMFREMEYTAKTFDLPSRTVLQMATTAGADAANLDCGVIEPGRRAALLVLDGDSDNLAGVADPVDAVVRRASPLDIRRIIH
jgi:cytosine/adenosine deaminase-related metal-dependent hydrolase